VIAYVRPYQESDFSRLLEIDRICFEPGIAYDEAALRYFLYHSQSLTLVLECDGSVSGLGIAARKPGGAKPRGHIITLDLLPGVRGKGFGRTLLERLEQWLAGQGAVEAQLEVDQRNTGAIGFYLKMGYRKERQLLHYYGKGLHACRMAHRLQP
jgi:ribosomal-protein-alanine N-acetyltransferase